MIRRKRKTLGKDPASSKKKPLARRPVVVKKKPVAKRPVPTKRKSLTKRPVPTKRKPLAKRPVPAKKKPVTRRPVPTKRKPPAKRPVPAKKKPVTRRPVSTKRKPLAKRPVPTKRKSLTKRPVPTKRKQPAKLLAPAKKPPKKQRRFPSFMPRAIAAESMMTEKLVLLNGSLLAVFPELDMSVKVFTNANGTVDGELRLRDLPDEWRTVEGMPALIEAFSNAFRSVGAFPPTLPMGGAFWISCGLRFGPKDRAELEQISKFYKRFRGLLQVGAYFSPAQHLTEILFNLMAIRLLVERVWIRRNLPPVQLLVRFAWTPTTERPARWQGEEGIKDESSSELERLRTEVVRLREKVAKKDKRDAQRKR